MAERVGPGCDDGFGTFSLFSYRFEALTFPDAMLGTFGFFVGERAKVIFGWDDGEASGEQVVASVAFGDIDDVTEVAEFLNIFTKQNLHLTIS